MISTAVAFLLGSLVLMVVMCFHKAFELQTGKAFLPIVAHPALNNSVTSWSNARLESVKKINKHTVNEFFHQVLVAVEDTFISLFIKLGKRFHKIGDMITGKDLPKNRGSVSTFLINIEHPRNDSSNHGRQIK